MLQKWLILKELVYVLQIPYKATLDFQSKTLTLSDVYGRWVSMRLHLNECAKRKSYQTELANRLVDALNSRKEVIFGNPLMVCALLLDPRFHSVVERDEQKKEQAKSQLLSIWRRLHILQSAPSPEKDTSSNSNDLSFEFDVQAAMDLHFTQPSLERTDVNHPRIEPDIEQIIDEFQPKPLPLSTNALQYWQQSKNEHPELYELAMVVFSIPPTEVQVERDFSSLDYIFTKRRCRLTEQRLADILLLHLNKDLFYEVNKLELQELHKKLDVKKNLFSSL